LTEKAAMRAFSLENPQVKSEAENGHREENLLACPEMGTTISWHYLSRASLMPNCSIADIDLE
jgi:hypothetical protein